MGWRRCLQVQRAEETVLAVVLALPRRVARERDAVVGRREACRQRIALPDDVQLVVVQLGLACGLLQILAVRRDTQHADREGPLEHEVAPLFRVVGDRNRELEVGGAFRVHRHLPVARGQTDQGERAVASRDAFRPTTAGPKSPAR